MAVAVIPCIFNRGCSAAKFLFASSSLVGISIPRPPALGGRGVSTGGGHDSCMSTVFDFKPKAAYTSTYGPFREQNCYRNPHRSLA